MNELTESLTGTLDKHSETIMPGNRQIEKPYLLTDKSKLQEIYDLRVFAYEHSHKAQYVNRQIFPTGWKDDLDELENTLHWVIEVDGRIIGATRLAILNDIKQTGEFIYNFEFPTGRPFTYWSRCVVHPEYRKLGLATMLDYARKNYILQRPEIKFAICWVTSERKNSVIRLGFNYIGESEYKFVDNVDNILPISVYLFIPTK